MKILDSDVIIDFLNKMSSAVSKVENIVKKEEIATTIFNEQEVLYGALKNKEDTILMTRQFFDSIKVLPYDRNCISKVLEIEFYLEKKGLPIGSMDELIAGICLAHNAQIITRNVAHFSRIPNLKVEKW